MIDSRAARLNMVDSQLRTNKVTDENVLGAFLDIPRERFVPAALSGIAYIDEDIPLGGGRCLLEPMVLARLLQLAAIGPEDSVLEIGAASGYGAAVLARLARRVVAVECDSGLIAKARSTLAALGCDNVVLIEAPLQDGHATGAPYDVIVIDGAVAAVPDAVSRQLAEGGRLVTVLKPAARPGQAVVMIRAGGALSQRPIFDVGTALLPGFEPALGFVF